MSFDIAFLTCFAAMLATSFWLHNAIHWEDLSRRERFMLNVMTCAAALFFPLTWLWVAVARLRRLALHHKH